eukprot:snap_masked-scaffold21_size687808-processed-gene-3.0 protein:Tk09836 transcript:snap_masked-scaffold21_size687808-processed-gene-3.0-mRNA-1 annotation:"PREDICTED: uncharacterized protein LOC103311848"
MKVKKGEKSVPNALEPTPKPFGAARGRPPKAHCSVKGCKNGYKNTTNIRFFCFPRLNQEQRALWATALSRADLNGSGWKPKSSSKICSDHFVGGRYSKSRLDPGYVPTIFSQQSGAGTNGTATPNQERVGPTRFQEPGGFVLETDFGDPLDMREESAGNNLTPINTIVTIKEEPFPRILAPPLKPRRDVGVQALIMSEKQNPAKPNQTTMGFRASCLTTSTDFLTTCGVTQGIFQVILDLLAEKIQDEHILLRSDKVALLLIKLKHNLPTHMLSNMFQINTSDASEVIRDTLLEMAKAVRPLIWWIPRETVQASLPYYFKKNHPMCRCIIDCAEIKCENSALEESVPNFSRTQKWSTVKFLIAIAPSGYITFLSKSHKDNQFTNYDITMESGILKLLKPNDVVMSDKGFVQIVEYSSEGFTVTPPPDQGVHTRHDKEETRAFGSSGSESTKSEHDGSLVLLNHLQSVCCPHPPPCTVFNVLVRVMGAAIHPTLPSPLPVVARPPFVALSPLVAISTAMSAAFSATTPAVLSATTCGPLPRCCPLPCLWPTPPPVALSATTFAAPDGSLLGPD